MLPSRLQVIDNADEGEGDNDEPPTGGNAIAPTANIHQVVISQGRMSGDVILPSVILGDQTKVDLIITVFNSGGNMSPLEVTDELKTKADVLVKTLQGRLRNHIKLRVKSESKQDHWCLKWAMNNLSVVAAYMSLFGHVKNDIGCLGQMSCLLADTNKFLLCTNTEANLQGCYLYFDTNEMLFVRSGKCTGRGFGARHAEHLKKALAPVNTDNSTFYDAYPSRDGQRANSSIKDGYFEFLQQKVAAGFDSTASTIFAKDYTDGGLFCFTDNERKFICNTKFSNREGDDKFAEMAAYLFEIGYDIALSTRNNKSDSPGFEACGLML